MSHPKVSLKRIKAISSSLFLVLLAVVSFTSSWWPGSLLVIGLPLSLRQFLLGRTYDTCISLTVFVGGFLVSSGYNIPWDILLPILFILGAIYIFTREFFDPNPLSEPEEEEALAKEIEEEDLHQ